MNPVRDCAVNIEHKDYEYAYFIEKSSNVVYSWKRLKILCLAKTLLDIATK